MCQLDNQVLEMARLIYHLSGEIDELRARVDALDRHRDGVVDPEQLAEIVASRLAPELDAVRRAARTGRKVSR